MISIGIIFEFSDKFGVGLNVNFLSVIFGAIFSVVLLDSNVDISAVKSCFTEFSS